MGQDTHALSQPALVTVLEVLAGNGVTAMVDADMDFVPTPSVSRAIIRYNESHDKKQMVSLLHHLTILQTMGALSIMLPTVALQIR